MPNKEQKNASVKQKAVALSLEFALIIILPLLFLVPLGKWMERSYHSRFWVIASLLAAFLTSTIWLIYKIKDIYKEFTNIN